ncbi:MAG: ChbG/HpnK family deacetylase [Chloroflexi bacterium]|nr:ChbG/HpnK family deacetylase [Chloroflexota bacterium]
MDVPVAPPGRPRLIVNADDFGQSDGINQGVAEARRQGIVTSASLMVRWPSAIAAADQALAHPDLSVGLHIDLGEWEFRAQRWQPIYTVLPSLDDAGAVEREVDAQVSRFRDLMGRPPTHLDSHQHVHRSEPVASIVSRVASALGVPLRGTGSRIRYSGAFYGQGSKGEPDPRAISVESLLAILRSLEPGVTELGSHPGVGSAIPGPYSSERNHEVAALCDPRVISTILEYGVELCSFSDLP